MSWAEAQDQLAKGARIRRPHWRLAFLVRAGAERQLFAIAEPLGQTFFVSDAIAADYSRFDDWQASP